MIKQVKIIEQEMKNFSIKMEILLQEYIDFLIINSVGEELFMKILQKQPMTQLLKN